MEQGNFADAAERSSTVSKTVETQSGLRTERVTLEIRHYDDNDSDSVYRWNWAEMMSEQGLGINESVRVVEEELSDAWAQRLARLTAERDAAIRERDEAAEFWKGELRSRTAERDTAIREREELRTKLEAAESCINSAQLIEHEWDDRERQWKHKLSAAEARVAELEAASGGGEQPRGWLTEEERELIAGITDDDEYTEEGQDIANRILARSTPPEVVLPDWVKMCVSHDRQNQLRKALAAAGVAVKEVQ